MLIPMARVCSVSELSIPTEPLPTPAPVRLACLPRSKERYHQGECVSLRNLHKKDDSRPLAGLFRLEVGQAFGHIR